MDFRLPLVLVRLPSTKTSSVGSPCTFDVYWQQAWPAPRMRSFADGITITPVKLSTTSFRVEHSQSLRMLNFDLYPNQTVVFYLTATEISHGALASGQSPSKDAPPAPPPPSVQRPIASLRYANPGDFVQAGARPI